MKSSSSSGFFRVAQHGGRWCFETPEGAPFFSLGLNHLDSATLRHADSDIWQRKYGHSTARWIEAAVVPDLQAWGFNTLGWTQEVVVRGEMLCRHSPEWSNDELRQAKMPFVKMLPFAAVHQWDMETRRPDVHHPDFAAWCDYVARRDCLDLRDEPLLLGYFFSDCPNWVHPSTNPDQIGPWFDPAMLESETGRRAFALSVETYYQTICQAVRRYDTHHLILGDRLEAMRPLPAAVIESAAKWCDVLSFQCFAEVDQIIALFREWHTQTGKPLLLADASVPNRRELSPEAQGALYETMLSRLLDEPYLTGWHYCGAYLENNARGAGLRDRFENPRPGLTDAMSRANRAVNPDALNALRHD